MDLPWGFYLGWDWPWLVFFIVLGISVALAWFMKSWQVLWVIPGLVLYSGLLWEIPGFWSFLFKLVFWVSLLVAVATAVLPGRTRLAKVPMYQMVALIVWCFFLWLFGAYITGWWTVAVLLAVAGILLLIFTKLKVLGIAALAAAIVIAGILLIDLDGSPEPGRDEEQVIDVCTNLPGEQEELPSGYDFDQDGDCAEVDAPPAEETPPAACPARFRQELDPNRQYRFESDGFEGTAREKRRQLVAALGHDYRYLSFMAEQLFDRPVADRTLVTDGRRCLTEKGRTLHAKVEGALMASGVQTGLAPRDGYNTGMRGDEAVVAKRRGVYGDRKATIYTLADGTRLIVLDRCGNMVLKSKPKGVPEGPTDNPPPPENNPPEDNPPEDTPGGCVEIPGNGIYDCGGKDPSEEPAQQGNVPEQVTGQNPGTGGSPASQPSAEPPDTYTPPPPPNSGSSGSGSGGSNTPPPEEEAPQPSNPEPSPTQDPCEVNPDWC